MSNKTHLRQTMLDLAEGRLRFAEQTYAQYLVGAAGRGDERGLLVFSAISDGTQS